MKWVDLFQYMTTLEAKADIAKKDVDIVRALSKEPVVMAFVEGQYRNTSGLGKKFFRKEIKELLDLISEGQLASSEEDSIRDLFTHFIDTICVYETTTNPVVRRWASCAKVLKDDSTKDLAVRVLNGNNVLKNFTRTSLQWTLSESTRLGCPCRPFNG